MKQLFNKRVLILLAVIIIAALTRFIPHPPNLTPILALALFGGTFFSNKRAAFIIPLIAMFISDIFLGFHSDMPAVYVSFLIVVCIGFFLKEKLSAYRVIAASLISSIIFYLITNFSMWLFSGMYVHSLEGLIECYTMAIPFFRNALLGDLFFNGVFFGGFYLIEKNFSEIKEIQKNEIY